ncbi:LacI family DNA-binding transcriptional regulator [Acrocarpospora phusangensis]|uniref:LacI family DNA-binding transcriptional regulator n=1 Tax=Acrocarpospora phusangensis TaxID=1070424 RepID=UPI001EF376A4|nr:substrate-binding domain-containing protein [Acrocarpospora phusangensis]
MRGSVALVVCEPLSRVFSEDPLFSLVSRSVSRELGDVDRHVVLMLANGAGSAARIERYVAGGHVEGVMLVSMHDDDPLPGAIDRIGVPVVSYGRPAVSVPLAYADNDNPAGARLAVNHLINRGRRRVATIAGPQDMIAGQDRLAGYHRAVADAGHRPIVIYGDFSRRSGADAMTRLLREEPAVDAVFAANDLMAIGALQALRQAGRRVPDDVAIAGYDDFEAAQFTNPPLTTVRHPVAEQVNAMTRLLVERMGGGPLASIVLPAELVIRASS